MTVKRILEATTGAAQSDSFTIENGSNVKVNTIVVAGLAGTETARVQMQEWDGGWTTMLTSTFTEFTVDLNSVAVIGPGTYRVDKDATAAAASVDLYS